MFYCNECASKNEWQETFSKSVGPCEMCGITRVCNDGPGGKTKAEPKASNDESPDLTTLDREQLARMVGELRQRLAQIDKEYIHPDPSVPNPCTICGFHIYGSYVGDGDGSMRNGGRFAHPECYEKRRMEAERDEARAGMAWLVDFFLSLEQVNATADREDWIAKATKYGQEMRAQLAVARAEVERLKADMAFCGIGYNEDGELALSMKPYNAFVRSKANETVAAESEQLKARVDHLTQELMREQDKAFALRAALAQVRDRASEISRDAHEKQDADEAKGNYLNRYHQGGRISAANEIAAIVAASAETTDEQPAQDNSVFDYCKTDEHHKCSGQSDKLYRDGRLVLCACRCHWRRTEAAAEGQEAGDGK